MLRKKLFKFDGLEVQYCSLSTKQVEEYLAPVDQIEGAAKGQLAIKKNREMVAAALNNALPKDTPEDQKFTADRVTEEFDMPTLEALQKEILTASGLRVLTPEEIKAAGERVPTGDTQTPSDGSNADSQPASVGATT